ncbi:hypothetical protein QT467_22400, partial [Xanthomonas citri pv. citri]
MGDMKGGDLELLKKNIEVSGTISVVDAKRLLKEGSSGFLAYLINQPKDKAKIEEVEVVKEFFEVFPDELISVPPDREIEFVIETLPGVTPISQTPYRMAPAELKELKNQLQDLVERGFIRPSTSPWGAPVLFVKKK